MSSIKRHAMQSPAHDEDYYRVIFTKFIIVKDMGTGRWGNWSML